MIIFKDKLLLHSISTSPIGHNPLNDEREMSLGLHGFKSHINLKMNNFTDENFLHFRNVFNEHKDFNKKQNRILLHLYYGEEWNI